MKILVKAVLSLCMFLYLLILTKLILFKYISIIDMNDHIRINFNGRYWGSHNFIPFKTIFQYIFVENINTSIRIENIAGNIVGFIPFGFLLPLLSKRITRLRSIVFATFGLSFTYEVLQLLFELGSFDIDDLILNTLGGVIGYLPIKLVHVFIKTKNNRHIRDHAPGK